MIEKHTRREFIKGGLFAGLFTLLYPKETFWREMGPNVSWREGISRLFFLAKNHRIETDAYFLVNKNSWIDTSFLQRARTEYGINTKGRDLRPFFLSIYENEPLHIIKFHTHHTKADNVERFRNLYANEVEPVYTLPPSATDIGSESDSVHDGIIDGHIPLEHFHFTQAVVDQYFVYYYRSLTDEERIRFDFDSSRNSEETTYSFLQETKLLWAQYVTNARHQGLDWEEIVDSSEFRELQNFYAKYHNVMLRAVPKRRALTEMPSG